MSARSLSRGAAYNITEECERLFCGTLRSVFLVEKNTGFEDSLVMDMQFEDQTKFAVHEGGYSAVQQVPTRKSRDSTLPTPVASPGTVKYTEESTSISAYLEVYDYTGGATFRGFIAENGQQRELFVFFSKDVLGKDLKPGYVVNLYEVCSINNVLRLTALLELASADQIEFDKLVVAVDRYGDAECAVDLIKDLGWVGLEMTTLESWSHTSACASERWVLLSTEV
ncbi:hypothetical protein MRB53_041560 [Persea americana]|nr:hypothetical protein MRB53_041560 [Persea americana]